MKSNRFQVRIVQMQSRDSEIIRFGTIGRRIVWSTKFQISITFDLLMEIASLEGLFERLSMVLSGNEHSVVNTTAGKFAWKLKPSNFKAQRDEDFCQKIFLGITKF